ncbi:MAG: DNA alkylation repair protein [Melioribacteraceae bacterium]|nr:DNA alkylation repair protein [Melioribacteraceae bacterium]
MNKLESKHEEIINFCIANSDDSIIKKYSRYFKEGYDGYGIDSKILESQKIKWLDLWKDEMTISEYLDLGDLLISTGKFEEADYATQFIASKKDKFSTETFDRIGNWLENGIQNWANTDVLCMLVLPEFIYHKIIEPKDFMNWTKSESKWKRRAVPVTFYEVIKKGHSSEPVFSVIEKLMEDKEEDVQKGLGTLLREIWKKQPEIAERFLLKWKDKCGRKIIHYATEKIDKDYKAKFKKTKK